jgi:hypothetical protein
LLIFIIFLLLATSGFVGWRIYQQQKKNTQSQSSSSESSQPSTENQEKKDEITYSDYKFKNTPFTITLPSTWKAEITEEYDQTNNGTNESYKGTLTGTNGWAVFFWFYQGGIGGYDPCDEPGEKVCPTYTVKTSEKTPSGYYFMELSTSSNDYKKVCAGIREKSELWDRTSDQIIAVKNGDAVKGDGSSCIWSFMYGDASNMDSDTPTYMSMSLGVPEENADSSYEGLAGQQGYKEAKQILLSLTKN